MARQCSVCTHDKRDAIDQALIAGQSYRQIAARFGVSQSALSRHLRRHLVALLAGRREVDADNLLGQVANLQRQAQVIKDKAEATGDLKTALQGIRELCRIIELLAKLRGELDTRPVVNVLLSPQWVMVRAVLFEALSPFPEARQAAAAALLEVDSESS